MTTRHEREPHPDDPPVVRLSGAAGIVLAAAQRLGFAPQDSIVLLALTRPRGRVGLVARADLFDPDDTDYVRPLVTAMRRYADEVAVVCYHTGARPACLDTVLAMLAAAGVPIHSVFSCADGLLREADDEAVFATDPGVPVPAPDDAQRARLDAAAALTGTRTLPDRDALRRSLAGPAGDAEAPQAAIRAGARLWPMLPHARPGHTSPSVAAELDALLIAALTETRAEGRTALETAGELIAVAQDTTCRDHLIARVAGIEVPELVPMLVSVTAQCPDAFAPGWCAVTAVGTARRGEGALANCAVERILAVDPGHRLGTLLHRALTSALPPHAFAHLADRLTWPMTGLGTAVAAPAS